MKKYRYLRIGALLMLLAAVNSGCVTESRCARKYPAVVKDSMIVKTRIVEVKDTLYIQGSTITRTDTVYKDGWSAPLVVENSFSKAKAQVKDNRLSLELTQKDTAIVFKGWASLTENYKVRTKIIEKPVVKWYDAGLRVLAMLLILIIFGRLLFKICIK